MHLVIRMWRQFQQNKGSPYISGSIDTFRSTSIVRLDVWARTVGIGAVLYHRYDNETERPTAYVFKALAKAEQKYSKIKREALNLVYRVKKFHNSLF